jgi:hypothetical protein
MVALAELAEAPSVPDASMTVPAAPDTSASTTNSDHPKRGTASTNG